MKSLILLSGLGVISMFSEIFRVRKMLFPAMIVGLGIVIGFLFTEWNSNNTYYGMMSLDKFGIMFTAIILGTAILWLLGSESYFKEESSLTDHFSLVLFSLVGAMLMVTYTNLALLFVGLEILSISFYIMAGSRKDSILSNEAGFKYFMMGAFATGFLLFGIALVYGATGSFDIREIANAVSGNTPTMFYAGVIMMLIGMLFKLSAAPFHFWAPDVYTGSPIEVTALMATVVKTAAIGAFVRLFYGAFQEAAGTWTDIVLVVSILTLFVGNITAVFQQDAKRMLAFSSVSHAGYLLIAVVSLSLNAANAILYYSAAYSIASLAAFTVVAIVINSKGDSLLSSFNGLGKKNPLVAVAMTVALLSLAGIPPVAGFFAKYFVFTSALENPGSRYVWLVSLAVVSSLIGVYYYFKIIIAMFFREADAVEVRATPLQQLLLVITIIGSIVLGIFPDLINQFGIK